MLSCGVHFIYICMGFRRRINLGWNMAALATRTVVHNLMSEEVTVNTEMIRAYGAFIATAYTHHPLCIILCGLPLLLGRHWGERYATCKACRTL